jgi:hypothetical protein
MDLSSALTTLIYTAGTMHKQRTHYQVHTINAKPIHVPFPAATTGFLYYHQNSVPASGEVRFRITPSDDPAAFASGTDLLMPHSIPWGIPLVGIAKRTSPPSHVGLKELLLRDNLVTTTTMDECARMKVSRGSRMIHSLGQPFFANLGSRLCVFVITSDGCLPLCLGFFTQRYKNTHLAHFSGMLSALFTTAHLTWLSPGSVLCCFERSDLPLHRGTRTIVIRILKIVSPIQSLIPNGPLVWPTEGDLIMKKSSGNIMPSPWSVDIDKHQILYAALRALLRNEEKKSVNTLTC